LERFVKWGFEGRKKKHFKGPFCQLKFRGVRRVNNGHTGCNIISCLFRLSTIAIKKLDLERPWGTWNYFLFIYIRWTNLVIRIELPLGKVFDHISTALWLVERQMIRQQHIKTEKSVTWTQQFLLQGK